VVRHRSIDIIRNEEVSNCTSPSSNIYFHRSQSENLLNTRRPTNNVIGSLNRLAGRWDTHRPRSPTSREKVHQYEFRHSRRVHANPEPVFATPSPLTFDCGRQPLHGRYRSCSHNSQAISRSRIPTRVTKSDYALRLINNSKTAMEGHSEPQLLG